METNARALLGAHRLRIAFGAAAPLLDGVGFQVRRGERVALVGRNGAGKSTLLRILAGEIEPDGGELVFANDTRVGRLDQQVPAEIEGSVFDVVAAGLPELGALLAEYRQVSATLDDPASLSRLEVLQAEIERRDGWEFDQRIETSLSRLGLDGESEFATLSGGLKRRALLARALVAEPDLLLLDEPTNHLDIASIEWMEELLLGGSTTLVFVTHDRAFLRRLATRILELDRGRLTDWPGDYARYLERKQEALEVEAQQAERFDKKLAEEEAWIRRGLKARRTRNEGRVRALERMREERRARRREVGRAKIAIDRAERTGKIVIEARDVGFEYAGAAPLVDRLSTTIVRGDKVGILGPNGSGKTTLLRLLLGELEPTRGSVRHGTRLEIAYFDQHREQLDEQATVADSIAAGSDKIEVGGRVKHVMSYLSDFLFAPDRARSPVGSLSGGERNRLLLARLFTRAANVLVLDEPTNDLDVETLELLEALLVDFDGTVLLVSHDRSFLDHVVTSTLVMEGEGRVTEYAGGYEDWLYQRPPVAVDPERARRREAAEAHRAEKRERAARARKLTYKEEREYEALTKSIEELEAEQSELHAKFADPTFFEREGSEGSVRAERRLREIEEEVTRAYDRWTELAEIAETA